MKTRYPHRIHLEERVHEIIRHSYEVGSEFGLADGLIFKCAAQDIVKLVQDNYRRRKK